MSTRNLRLKFTDFSGTDYESYIMLYLENILDTHKLKLNLDLWYDNKTVSDSVICKFKNEYQSILKKFNYYTISPIYNDMFAWYDIIHECDCDRFKQFKFRNTYCVSTGIIEELIKFNIFAKNINVGNDGDNKYRNDWVSQIRKQSSNYGSPSQTKKTVWKKY